MYLLNVLVFNQGKTIIVNITVDGDTISFYKNKKAKESSLLVLCNSQYIFCHWKVFNMANMRSFFFLIFF